MKAAPAKQWWIGIAAAPMVTMQGQEMTDEGGDANDVTEIDGSEGPEYS